ncbi:MAG: tRNA pseudouridine(13) synthase TruD, partial [Thermodesulfobacteriota bacterium]|nr:tRNA pseudouridine(13) synthase TruD [Thermodesulfobacteriota bacterium]
GEIKTEPRHFVVEEIPVYEPVGEGGHVFVRLTREGWTTRNLLRRLTGLFGLRDVDAGCAGLKDKQARVTQTVSLLLPGLEEDQIARRIEDALEVEVVWVRRHSKKLKTGHLLGNRFTVIIQNPDPDGLVRAEEIAEALKVKGLPNYYGLQRFGVKGDNAAQGREILLGRGPRERWLRRFLVSAFQAHLFNTWLSERIRREWFERLLTGDLAKKTDTGGLFDVEDLEAEQPRFEKGEITYTGPIYGGRMRRSGGEPGALEDLILEQAGVTAGMLGRARADGSRRTARIFPAGLDIRPHDLGLILTFALPKGAYATTLLRELMKTESLPPAAG